MLEFKAPKFNSKSANLYGFLWDSYSNFLSGREACGFGGGSFYALIRVVCSYLRFCLYLTFPLVYKKPNFLTNVSANPVNYPAEKYPVWLIPFLFKSSACLSETLK